MQFLCTVRWIASIKSKQKRKGSKNHCLLPVKKVFDAFDEKFEYLIGQGFYKIRLIMRRKKLFILLKMVSVDAISLELIWFVRSGAFISSCLWQKIALTNNLQLQIRRISWSGNMIFLRLNMKKWMVRQDEIFLRPPLERVYLVKVKSTRVPDVRKQNDCLKKQAFFPFSSIEFSQSFYCWQSTAQKEPSLCSWPFSYTPKGIAPYK